VVKLICFLKRKPGMGVEEFHRYWREVHGPLVASTRSGRHVIRYEQSHRTSADYDRDPDGFDGVAEQWFESVDAFRASLAEPDYARIAEDLGNFLDLDSLVFVLTDEPEVVIDRRVR
jgi:uncharacterized protein (TIGR02118 family)